MVSVGYVFVSYGFLTGGNYEKPILWANVASGICLLLNNMFCFLSWRLSIDEEGEPPGTDWWLVGNWIYVPGTLLYVWQSYLMFDPVHQHMCAIINVVATTVFLIDAIAFYLGYHHWW